jgi:hypothetical protein
LAIICIMWNNNMAAVLGWPESFCVFEEMA